MACLREAAEDPQGSLYLACGADLDLTCVQADGAFICRVANGCCQHSDCPGGAIYGADHTCQPNPNGGDGGIYS